MSNRLILHAGMHKTGTTALQNALAATGSGPGWEYLTFKVPNASNIIAQGYAGQKRPQNGLPQPSYARDPEEARRLIRGRLSSTKAHLALISGETLRHFSVPVLHDFMSACRDTVPALEAIEAVVYVRAPLSFLQASYQQRLQTRFIPISRLVELERLDYAKQFARLEKAIGPERMSYRPYLRSNFPEKSVVKDFAAWLELGFVQEPPASTNRGLSSEAVRLLYLWRQFHDQLTPGDGKIIHLLSKLDGPPLHFSENLLGVARPFLEPQFQWAQARMDWDMREDPEADKPHSIRSEADFQVLEAETLEWLGKWSGMSVKILRRGPDAVIEGLAALRDRKHLGVFASRTWSKIGRRLRAR